MSELTQAAAPVASSQAAYPYAPLGGHVLTERDPELAAMLAREAKRQSETIDLIASENHVGQSILEAQGSVLTNKYAEGYPGRRYYGGCDHVDEVESLAIERAKALFGAEHVNVQPHSGSQANAAAYMAMLNLGDTVLAMSLNDGGHLTHGHKLSFSGRQYDFHHYGVSPDTETIDYDLLEQQAKEIKPRLIVAGASAYPRIIDFPRLREIADAVGAYLMVDMAHIAGLVAAGVHPSPVPYADVVTTTTHKTLRGPRGGLILCRKKLAKKVNRALFPGTQGGPLTQVIAAKAVNFREAMTDEFRAYEAQIVTNAKAMADELTGLGMRLVSGGTDNHMMLVDLRDQDVTGLDAQKALQRANIVCNKNAIPFDPRPPAYTSGIRLGTPAVTTRGFTESQMRRVAQLIHLIVTHIDDDDVVAESKEEVLALCEAFPIPM